MRNKQWHVCSFIFKLLVYSLVHALLSLSGLHMNPAVSSTCIMIAVTPPTGVCISATACRVQIIIITSQSRNTHRNPVAQNIWGFRGFFRQVCTCVNTLLRACKEHQKYIQNVHSCTNAINKGVLGPCLADKHNTFFGKSKLLCRVLSKLTTTFKLKYYWSLIAPEAAVRQDLVFRPLPPCICWVLGGMCYVNMNVMAEYLVWSYLFGVISSTHCCCLTISRCWLQVWRSQYTYRQLFER